MTAETMTLSSFGADAGDAACCGCGRAIFDKYLLRIKSDSWHEQCAVCSVCQANFQDTCFVRDGKLFCRYDYAKLYGTCCSGCGHAIVSSELVMRAQQLVYHVHCFTCAACGVHLRQGDQFVLRNGHLLCRSDYERELVVLQPLALSGVTNVMHSLHGQMVPDLPHLVGVNGTMDMAANIMGNILVGGVGGGGCSEEDEMEDSDSDVGSRSGAKRPRTILTTAQRRKFKQAFELNPKPSRKVREVLASETGLTVRVVQVWFQNQRAKVKKLARRHNAGVTLMNIANDSVNVVVDGANNVDSMASFADANADNENDGASESETNNNNSCNSLANSKHWLVNSSRKCAASRELTCGNLSESSPSPIICKDEQDLGSENNFTSAQHHISVSDDPMDKLYSMQNSYFT